ncbi:hypothetical protein GUJ93_ZPchr0009g2284 [Zizania palustris]|uniref:KAT8 regulatory NSL complex subunit 2 n=1 Tax=Zizania palustris TaxID=103762 RepID=A0A8J5RSW7_ZIZPA|nr:hypothetical protein GUJ93_ZPchr0009g2284 [Zizania palustris]
MGYDPDKSTAPPRPPLPPVVLAGAVEDSRLGLASALTREEVIRRRRRRAHQLRSIYRGQYWALAEELSAKHADYWLEQGASPVVDDAPGNAGAAPAVSSGVVNPVEACGAADNCGPPPPPTKCSVGAAVTPAAGSGRAGCSSANCRAKAMPLSAYCFNHILLDPKQLLYKPCGFITNQSGMQNGVKSCGKPVLKSTAPLRCSDHDPKSQKLVVEVHQIQMKRKLHLNGAKKVSSHRSRK